ncbi:hypothetical protein GZ78_13560 [Endozoicomonas numazuensis]|uniref:Uncharacterized protein n=1 Tax=Endozoicomonas numazuensis TaxID=1137799 RepID=A0A081NJ82_9GAMM|nr:hypothetical protein GZ78_13560 [Endozoicomonas numazuensis]
MLTYSLQVIIFVDMRQQRITLLQKSVIRFIYQIFVLPPFSYSSLNSNKLFKFVTSYTALDDEKDSL